MNLTGANEVNNIVYIVHCLQKLFILQFNKPSLSVSASTKRSAEADVEPSYESCKCA
jgi:hypothetical protein